MSPFGRRRDKGAHQTPLVPLPGTVLCDICPFPAVHRFVQHRRSLTQTVFGLHLRVAFVCSKHLAEGVEYVRTGKQPEFTSRWRRRAR